MYRATRRKGRLTISDASIDETLRDYTFAAVLYDEETAIDNYATGRFASVEDAADEFAERLQGEATNVVLYEHGTPVGRFTTTYNPARRCFTLHYEELAPNSYTR